MSVPHVIFTSLGRLTERNGVIAAATVDGKAVLCHFLRETLLKFSGSVRTVDSLDLFRAHRDGLAQLAASITLRDGLHGEFLHLLPSDVAAASTRTMAR